MNRTIFNDALYHVASAYGVSESALFISTKRPSVTEPRQVLWMICDTKGIRVSAIRDFTTERGLPVHQSTVIRGIARARKIADTDRRVNDLILSA